MKKLIIASLICFSTLAATAAYHPTDETNVVNSVNSIAANTNITQAVISILSGVKNVGGEIYDTSKVAIGQSVDFVKQQAPDVVEQFLKWKFFESAIYTVSGLVGFILIGLIVYFSLRAMIKYESWEMSPILMVFILPCIPCWCGLSHIMTCAYIYCAPKVYLIDYIITNLKH
jgi:predicted ferric reductase